VGKGASRLWFTFLGEALRRLTRTERFPWAAPGAGPVRVTGVPRAGRCPPHVAGRGTPIPDLGGSKLFTAVATESGADACAVAFRCRVRLIPCGSSGVLILVG